MVILAGFPKKYLLAIFVSSLLVFILAWSFFFKDYQRQRILTFLNPGDNSLVEGYNISQAIIAVGSGSWHGKGVGLGSQSQLKFLPEAQNDFIFSVIAEELGFFGVAVVLLLFSLFFSRCLAAVRRLPNDFSIYFVLGYLKIINRVLLPLNKADAVFCIYTIANRSIKKVDRSSQIDQAIVIFLYNFF